ncbi:MAG: hypothetical protein KJZ83_13925 [Burkholderiaceae bacterium]|nr:hypothetical protein [Burkholderiaceae bacterium]
MCAETPHKRSLAGARRHVCGQALIEVLVAALALVPLLLLVAWLGKVQALRQATIAASRSLAFECSVRLDECADAAGVDGLADEVRRRSFSRLDAPVLAIDRLGDDPGSRERNPAWVDRGNRALIERFSDIGVRVERQRFDAGESVAHSRGGNLVADAASLLEQHAGPGRFGLDIRSGLLDAQLQVGMSSSARPSFRNQLDSIPLTIRARTAILVDSWNASGPYGGDARSVRTRVERGRQILAAYEATIDARYLPTRGFLALMGAIGLEPSADAFRYHEVDVDIVPHDRVGSATRGASTASSDPARDAP